MQLKNKLQRLKGHMKLDGKPSLYQPQQQAEQVANECQIGSLKGKKLYLEDQYTIYREVEYPLSYRFGNHSLNELIETVDSWNSQGSQHPLSAKGLQADELLFFDTETTGLGGGTGNTIFLIGYCHLRGDKIVVKQFFLPGPAHEVALYYHFLQDVKKLTNLVTYNGKAFDWPQVKTRHTLVRDQVPNLPKFGHFDLLHAARRLFKDQLPSCRLSIVEKEKLGIERVDDTSGSLAPILYFDYMRSGDISLLEGIFKHNEWDVLSLVVLYSYISKKLLSFERADTIEEAFQVGKWYEALGETQLASIMYKQVADSSSRKSFEAYFHLGIIFKKEKRFQEALGCFEKVIETSSQSTVNALIELAKLYEHQFKNNEKALLYAKQSLDFEKDRQRIFKDRKELSQIEARVKRLEGKVARES